MLATTVRQPRGRHCGCADCAERAGGKGKQGKRRTEFVYRVVWWHALGNACEDVEGGMRIQEGAAKVGEVGDEDAWVELALEEAETCVLEACLAQAFEAEPLINVCQLFRLPKDLLERRR
jgi:hypothetical protein